MTTPAIKKNKFLAGLITVLIFIILVNGFYVFNLNQAEASPGTVEFTDDVILGLDGLGVTVYITAGSTADSLTISSNSLSISGIDADSAFLLKNASGKKFLQVAPSGDTADFSFSTAYSYTYTDEEHLIQWKSASSTETTFTAGVPQANEDYVVRVNGEEISESPVNSGSDSEVVFTWTGSGEEETFVVGTACWPHNVWGYAWSENIGWISFSCENETEIGEGINYGVDIDTETGVFSGYAWSENIGWITFNEDELSGCPSSPCRAQIDFETNEISGWARILNYGDGWDGWINLNNADYGLWLDKDVTPFEFRDWAWSEDIGWVSFNCADREDVCSSSDYKVMTLFVPPINIYDLEHEFAYCTQSRIPIFSWTVEDEEFDDYYDYDVRICTDSNCAETILVQEEKRNIKSKSWSPLSPPCLYCCDTSTNNYNSVEFGSNTYYGQVRVSPQGEEVWSDWATDSFITPDHCYPITDFLCNGGSCENFSAHEEQIISLSDDSYVYDGEETWQCSWGLPDGHQLLEGYNYSDCYIEATFTVGEEQEQEIGLTVTDSSEYSCTKTKEINVLLPLPEYKEIKPE